MTPEQKALQLISSIAQRRTRVYLLQWNGSKIPRGFIIGDCPIVWTQHGIVIGHDHIKIGEYERLEEYGGTDGTRHLMMVFTDLQGCKSPTGDEILPLQEREII
jgi:hypothetical protein